MVVEVNEEMSLFVRDAITGRVVFNCKAIEALGLNPMELALRGYRVDAQVTSPTLVPDDGQGSVREGV